MIYYRPKFDGLSADIFVTDGEGKAVFDWGSDGLGRKGSRVRAIQDTIESILLAHACAGINIGCTAYIDGMDTAIGAIFNEYGD